MNRTETLKAISEIAEVSEADVGKVLDAITQILFSEAKLDGKVVLQGIGKIIAKVRAARKGRNPRTGESVDVPEKRVLKFKADKDLLNSIQ